MKYVFIVLGFLVVLALSSILSGYVLTVLWDWFIVSFFDVSQLTIPYAIGFSLIIGYLTHQKIEQDDDKSTSDKLGEAFIYATIKPLAALLIGWIVTLFL